MNVIDIVIKTKDDSSDGFDKVKRKVKETEDSVKDLEATWRDANGRLHDANGKFIADTEEMGDGVDGAGESMGAFGKVGAAAMVGVGAAIAGVTAAVGLFASKLSEAMDIEKGRDRLAAQLGLTAEQSEAFGRTAGQLYAGAYGESLDEVNEALRYVQQNIGDGMGNADDALKTVTASVMDLASAFGEDLGPISRAAGIMVKNGLAGDATAALDLLTVGLQNGANAGEDLLDTFSEYSPKFAELGIDATKAMGMISQAMKAGARDSDFVADALKEFAIKSKDASDSSIEAFQALGLNGQKMTAVFAKGGPEADRAMAQVIQRLRDMKDPVAQNAAAVGLFGTKAEDLGRTLYAIDPTTAVSALGQVEGAAKRMGDTLADNASTKIETFKRSLQQGINDFMTNTVLPGIVSTVEKIGEAFGPKLDIARQNWDTFVAALQGEGKAPEWMQPIVDMVEKLRAKFDEFKPQLEDFYNNVLKKVEEAWPSIEAGLKSFYDNALVPFFNFVGDNSEQLKNWAVTIGIVAAVITGVLLLAFGALVVGTLAVIAAVIAVGIVLNMIIQVIWDVFNNVRDALGGVIDWFENLIQIGWDLAQNIGSAIADAVRWVWGFLTGVNDMANKVGQKIDEVIRWFLDLPGRISTAVGDLGSLLVDAGRAILDGLVRGFQGALDWAKGKIGDGLKTIRNLFPFSPAKEGPFSGSGYTDVSGAKMMEDFAKGATSRTARTAAAVTSALTPAAASFAPGAAPGMPASGAGAGMAIVFKGNTDTAFASAFMQLVRSGQIEIQPAGAF